MVYHVKPPRRVDSENGRTYYTVADALTLSPEQYAAWVYHPKTKRVSEVRVYRSQRVNTLINRWPTWLPHVLWWPTALYLMLPLSSPRLLAALFGACFFPLLEVCFHRFIFHMPVRTRFAQRLHIVLHGSHHLAPNDRGRMTSHPFLVASYSTVLYGLLVYLHMPQATAAIGGLLVGYLRTDTMHVAAHIVPYAKLRRVPLIGGFLAVCKRRHLAHHFVDAGGDFPISFYWPGVLWATVRGAGARRARGP